MKIIINDKHKKDLFNALFQTLKNCSNIVCIIFHPNHIHIQGMDKSHVCLLNINIKDSWFNSYEKNTNDVTNICFDTNIFHNVINTANGNYTIIIHNNTNNSTSTHQDNTDIDTENIHIDLIANDNKKGEFNKYFKIPLANYEYELMNIPVVDYDAEFLINAKKICEITTQMLTFGSDINVKCTEEKIDLITNGLTGEMLVDIPIDDLTEYSISEGDVIDLNYSLNYIVKMCLTNKLSNEIDFSISGNYPMRIKYNLGDESDAVFYIAPKI